MSSVALQGWRAAIDARVSSERQAQDGTIDSQVQALRERVREEGLELDPELCFLDEGCRGSTRVRPALERLRDQAAARAIDRLYVHSPDRLARRYAYQVLLVDELQDAGVELVFLHHPLGQGPEDDRLRQVQGIVAEYERAKILERSRRGKLHAARRGARRDHGVALAVGGCDSPRVPPQRDRRTAARRAFARWPGGMQSRNGRNRPDKIRHRNYGPEH